ncbi:MAG TPA: ABC transporter permease [Methylomirabilota bacterium]|jgi:peptide/nickel transport system permease protein|nr:ABC transporter permease [Methylomirabilota bacterium]
MTRYLLRRLALLPLALFGVSLVTFALTRIIPGDPTDRLVGAAFLTEERRAEIRREYGLDRPLAAQFAAYLAGLARGDLGTSFLTSRPVGADLRQRFPATLELTAAAMLFAVVLAVPLGVASAVWKDSWLDHLGRVVAVLGVSMPVFWSGLILLYLFFFRWPWAPAPIGRLEPHLLAPPSVTGLVTIDALLAGDGAVLGGALRSLALPALALGLAAMAPLARMARATMLEALGSDYVRAARALGLAEGTVVVRHALRTSLLPVITMIAVVFGYQLGGVVLVEAVFAWPGLGQYAYHAVANADYPAVQGFILYTTTMYIALFLIVDLLSAVLDPRVRAT